MFDAVGRRYQPGGAGLRRVFAVLFQRLSVHQQLVRVHEQAFRFHSDGALHVVHVENLIAHQSEHPILLPDYLVYKCMILQ